ncbi:unnamed protein product [Ixodes persulcatus]
MNRACLAPLSTVVLEAAVRRAPQSTSGTRVTGPISLQPSQPAKNVGGKKIESLEHGGCLAAHSAAAAAVVRQQGLVPVLRTAAGGEGGPQSASHFVEILRNRSFFRWDEESQEGKPMT